jgi:hypothetical protein
MLKKLNCIHIFWNIWRPNSNRNRFWIRKPLELRLVDCSLCCNFIFFYFLNQYRQNNERISWLFTSDNERLAVSLRYQKEANSFYFINFECTIVFFLLSAKWKFRLFCSTLWNTSEKMWWCDVSRNLENILWKNNFLPSWFFLYLLINWKIIKSFILFKRRRRKIKENLLHRKIN